MGKEIITLGSWIEDNLDKVIRKSSEIKKAGERIDFLSRLFLDTPYRESTLIGASSKQEEFVINLAGVDCFTFIDYIEAMRLSGSFAEFREQLKAVRYQSGRVSYETRNHFFTGWVEFNASYVHDVTAQIGAKKAIAILKELNRKEDGSLFLDGIQTRRREIAYIPSDAVDRQIADKIETGDYIGIYSNIRGLDVSHVGIFIRTGENVYLRHASSGKEYRKVVDQDFKSYIVGKPGIIVLRSK